MNCERIYQYYVGDDLHKVIGCPALMSYMHQWIAANGYIREAIKEVEKYLDNCEQCNAVK